MTQNSQQSQKQSNLTNLCYMPIRDMSHLSPYHERVSIQKQYIRKKQQLRSILIMGHLQKMELNAINNRSMQTMMKAKKAQQMSKKRNSPENQNPMQKKQFKKLIKIDTRKNSSLHHKTQVQSQIKSLQIENESMEQLCDHLIDEYLRKAAKQKILENGIDRKKIVQQACKQIQSQITERYSKVSRKSKQRQQRSQRYIPNTEEGKQKRRNISFSDDRIILPTINQFSHKKKLNRQSQRSFQISKSHLDSHLKINESHNLKLNSSVQQVNIKKIQQKSIKQKKSHRYRSITQIQYNENMKKLQIQKKYLSKQRLLEEKMFLRKMKIIGIKNVRTFKYNLRAYEKTQESGKNTIQ